MKEIIVYTTDDETPRCMRCEHFGDDNYSCSKHCGVKRAWRGYERYEYKDEED